ncbi:hypothetical protein LCI18_002201 [Fusarium solani-melongenae]|uniref:Uncharacterized protein n=1 Tax=Fusarium solani subsp. cucurbitae TaxID=2747967 RepID=A0ACD3YRN2_FUSSC|nr:hypothetical protein LCI18_002201 [Fusarium solani-melongenae]
MDRRRLPDSPAPDGPTDRTPCRGPDAVGWTLKELDKHNERCANLDLESQDKVTRWMRDRIGILYCDLLPNIPSAIYPSDMPGNYMHPYPHTRPESETLPSPTTPSRASPFRSGTRRHLSPEERYFNTLDREKSFHNLLTRTGGRAWYPIERIDEVSRKPTQHAEVLKYWQGLSEEPRLDDWVVYERQWERWDQFHRYQLSVRTQPEAFSEHSSRCQKRLAKHSFAGSLHLEKNLAEQTELSDWIEYLCFEYFQYEKFLRHKQSHQQYKEAWRNLVSTKVLKPDETQGDIDANEFAAACEKERTSLRQAVEIARSNTLLADRDMLDPNLKGPTAQRKLFEAQAELDSAIKEFDDFQIRKRKIEDYKKATATYRAARDGAKRHEILLRWIRDQIPLIEEKLGLPTSTEDGLVLEGGDNWNGDDADDPSLVPKQLSAPQRDGKKRARLEDDIGETLEEDSGSPPKRSKQDED